MAGILNILGALWNATNPHAGNEYVTKSVSDQVDAKAVAAHAAADAVNARLDAMYPVGTVWMTLDATDPSTIFPGNWDKTAEGRMLIGTGTLGSDTYTSGITAGEARHALTVDEMPSHDHDIEAWATNSSAAHQHGGEDNDGVAAPPGVSAPSTENWTISGADNSTELKGGGQEHENRPPYLAVNIWQRTA